MDDDVVIDSDTLSLYVNDVVTVKLLLRDVGVAVNLVREGALLTVRERLRVHRPLKVVVCDNNVVGLDDSERDELLDFDDVALEMFEGVDDFDSDVVWGPCVSVPVTVIACDHVVVGVADFVVDAVSDPLWDALPVLLQVVDDVVEGDIEVEGDREMLDVFFDKTDENVLLSVTDPVNDLRIVVV